MHYILKKKYATKKLQYLQTQTYLFASFFLVREQDVRGEGGRRQGEAN